MIALEVELLTGRYVATSFNDRSAPEWPPHPARLFSALVATAHEHEEITATAREALDWLSQQGAPVIEATAAEVRSTPAMFVPENAINVLTGWANAEQKLEGARKSLDEAAATDDVKAVKSAQKAVAAAEKKLAETMHKATVDDGKGNPGTAREMLPDRRGKQPRLFPSIAPHEARVRYIWSNAAPTPELTSTLMDLSRRLARLGHSSSLVACRVLDTAPDATSSTKRWCPTPEGTTSMRIADAGQLNRLEEAHARHQGVEPRVLPAVHQAYAFEGDSPSSAPLTSVFGEWVVLREVPGENGRRVGLKLQRTEDITRSLRGALLSHAEAPIPEILSGHTADGRPIDRPHVAYVPLADVGSRYASGNVLGVAILLPRGVNSEERRAVLRAIGRWENQGLRLTLGRVGALELERVIDSDPRQTLDPAYWMRPARRWGSVTPVALDKNPGDLYSDNPKEAAEAVRRAEEIVMRSCERVGLPAPRWVEIIRRSLFDAAPAARDYMPFPRKSANPNAHRRVCVHIEMSFDEPVAGPVLIGAGRYFGVGLCRGRE